MFGASTMTGRRAVQQDSMAVNQRVRPDCRLFGVFDGHGGSAGGTCSKLASKCLKDLVAKHISFSTEKDIVKATSQALVDGFKEFDEYLRCPPVEIDPKLKRRQSWKRILLPASWFPANNSINYEDSGSCACVMVTTPEALVFANLGDSSAILSDGTAVTTAHTASSVTELRRVFEAGGWIVKDRVYGRLVPTRAFGDFEMKKTKNGLTTVSAEPEIHVVPLNADTPKFVAIVCDGVTDVLSNKEVGILCENNSHLHPTEIADIITMTAFKRGSKDNLSCIVVRTDSTGIPETASYDSSDSGFSSSTDVSDDEHIHF